MEKSICCKAFISVINYSNKTPDYVCSSCGNSCKAIQTIMTEEEEIIEPVGNFIMSNAKGTQTASGMYYHYTDVCSLLRKYLASQPKQGKGEKKINSKKQKELQTQMANHGGVLRH